MYNKTIINFNYPLNQQLFNSTDASVDRELNLIYIIKSIAFKNLFFDML